MSWTVENNEGLTVFVNGARNSYTPEAGESIRDLALRAARGERLKSIDVYLNGEELSMGSALANQLAADTPGELSIVRHTEVA